MFNTLYTEPAGSVSLENLTSADFGCKHCCRGTEFYIYREIYYENLTHVIMGVEKSYNLSSAHWRPKKARDIIQFKTEGLGARGVDWHKSQPKAHRR